MNTIESVMFSIGLSGVFLTMVLYVVFGQVTVRKLRRNPETKEKLGIEYVSGWDIVNVAQTLSIPKWLSSKLEKSPLSFLYADSKVLYEYTNRFDRILAMLFYWCLTLSGLILIGLVALNAFGMFDKSK